MLARRLKSRLDSEHDESSEKKTWNASRTFLISERPCNENRDHGRKLWRQKQTSRPGNCDLRILQPIDLNLCSRNLTCVWVRNLSGFEYIKSSVEKLGTIWPPDNPTNQNTWVRIMICGRSDFLTQKNYACQVWNLRLRLVTSSFWEVMYSLW